MAICANEGQAYKSSAVWTREGKFLKQSLKPQTAMTWWLCRWCWWWQSWRWW